MVRPKRIAFLLIGGLLLHLTAMMAMFRAGGMIMGGFEDGIPASPLAAIGVGFARIVWLPLGALPGSLSGVASHLAGLLSACLWVGAGYSLAVVWNRRRTREQPRAAGT